MDILIRIVSLLIAIVGHEIAHGYVAYLLGDTTAKDDGRLSLNPINHIDPIGLLSMIVFRFGWAKAVPINPMYFKNRKVGTILVSLAGVTYNFIAALIFGVLYVYFAFKNQFLSDFFSSCLWYNVMLGVFNLVPLPPLDGSKVVASLLPRKVEYFFYKYEKYFYIILVVGIFSGIVSNLISPIINFVIEGALRISVWVLQL